MRMFAPGTRSDRLSYCRAVATICSATGTVVSFDMFLQDDDAAAGRAQSEKADARRSSRCGEAAGLIGVGVGARNVEAQVKQRDRRDWIRPRFRTQQPRHDGDDAGLAPRHVGLELKSRPILQRRGCGVPDVKKGDAAIGSEASADVRSLGIGVCDGPPRRRWDKARRFTRPENECANAGRSRSPRTPRSS